MRNISWQWLSIAIGILWVVSVQTATITHSNATVTSCGLAYAQHQPEQTGTVYVCPQPTHTVQPTPTHKKKHHKKKHHKKHRKHRKHKNRPTSTLEPGATLITLPKDPASLKPQPWLPPVSPETLAKNNPDSENDISPPTLDGHSPSETHQDPLSPGNTNNTSASYQDLAQPSHNQDTHQEPETGNSQKEDPKEPPETHTEQDNQPQTDSTGQPSDTLSVSAQTVGEPSNGGIGHLDGDRTSQREERTVEAGTHSKIIGISVGAVCGCVAAAGLAGMFIYRHRQKRQEEEAVPDELNTRYRTQSFMAVVAGAVAKLPKRDSARSSLGVLGTLKRAASKASQSLSRSSSKENRSMDPMPPLSEITPHQHAY